MGRLRYPCRSDFTLLVVFTIPCIMYYFSLNSSLDKELSRRYIQNKLEEALKVDKGMGCEIPDLDPFSKEITRLEKKVLVIQCAGNPDWVKCNHSKCRVVDYVKRKVKDIQCTFKYILYESDQVYTLGREIFITGDTVFELTESDHVKVSCYGIRISDEKTVKWSGNTLGLRKVTPKDPPPGRENSYNVLMFAFDSTAKNGFIRKMPLSWKVLTEELGATVMEGYNILGDGTPAALFPILTGKTELELPEARKAKKTTTTLDSFPFIFYKLKDDGYRTAYFEDMPEIGTFQHRFNGFRHQPADHYLRAFFMEEIRTNHGWFVKLLGDIPNYCLGDIPQYKLMINITQQFMELDGKRFAFTFISDITHQEFDLVQNADADTAEFLRGFAQHAENTLLVVMGDHGPRFSAARETFQGKLEERLPLLAILLPRSLMRSRPGAAAALQVNSRTLCTPHDLHATLLDVLGMTQHMNPYKVKGADLTRGMTLLEPIPDSRSCSEAGIEPHWCACLSWEDVSVSDPLYQNASMAVVQYINELVKEVGTKCLPRTLKSIKRVSRQRPRHGVLEFARSWDQDGYKGQFTARTQLDYQYYQVLIEVEPGRGMFEASLMYGVKEDKFIIDTRDISRTSAYGAEPLCIMNTHPHLKPFCYCAKETQGEDKTPSSAPITE